MTHKFDLETQSGSVADSHRQLTLSPHWSIGNNPNGGYLLACLLRAMQDLVPDTPDPVAVTTHYLRPGLPEQLADLHVEVVRSGRRTATVTGTMEQDGKPRLTCTATFSSLAPLPESGAPTSEQRSLAIAPPVLPPPDDCIARTELAQGVELPITNRLDIRIDPKYAEAGAHDEAVITGWIRFLDERPADVMALPLFCDAFPPSIFSLYGRIGWVPTIELSIHTRRRPQPGWIKGLFTTRDVAGDLFIEDGLLWDETDRLVAQARQLQMILSPQ